jgi:hypothetical protein
VAVACGAMLLLGGCKEFVHMGQISDRQSAWSISGVLIEQQQVDGSWKQLNRSDGNGKWWILKDNIHGGGKIRLSKSGYYSVTMPEAEFLQQSNLLMIPSGEAEVGDEYGGR